MWNTKRIHNIKYILYVIHKKWWWTQKKFMLYHFLPLSSQLFTFIFLLFFYILTRVNHKNILDSHTYTLIFIFSSNLVSSNFFCTKKKHRKNTRYLIEIEDTFIPVLMMKHEFSFSTNDFFFVAKPPKINWNQTPWNWNNTCY